MRLAVNHNSKRRSALLVGMFFIALFINLHGLENAYADNNQWLSKVDDDRFTENPEHGTNQATLNVLSDEFNGPDRLLMLDDILINATGVRPSEEGDLVALKDKDTNEVIIAATNHYEALEVSQVGDTHRRLSFLDPFGGFDDAFLGTSKLWADALNGASPLTHFSNGSEKVYIGLSRVQQAGRGGIQIGSRFGEPGLVYNCGGATCYVDDVVIRPQVFFNDQLIRPAQMWFISGGQLSGLYRLTLDDSGFPLEGAEPVLVAPHSQNGFFSIH